VSTLAHYLESEGLATTLVALVRDHAERCMPPRALWASFELGRPLGAPNNAAFQREVLLAALNLLIRERGPVILEDFPKDDPNAEADLGWSDPVVLPDGGSLAEEVAAVKPAYETAIARTGRTTVGLTGMSMDETVEYINAIAEGRRPESPLEGYSSILGFRFAADDIKAFYLEAASGGGHPNSKQMVAWFWDQTIAGQTLIAIRSQLQASDRKAENVIGNLTLVPGVQVVRKQL